MEVISLVIAAVSAAGTVGALCIAILANGKSNRAIRAAEQATAIEAGRRREELTPEFDIRCRQPAGWGDKAKMRVAFRGPAGLDRLDSVEIVVRDDSRPALPRYNPDRAAQIEDHVWGPWRFEPGVDGADREGRRVILNGMQRGDFRDFQIARTFPLDTNFQSAQELWDDQYQGHKILLQLRCKAGELGWEVPEEVSAPSRPEPPTIMTGTNRL